MHLSVYFWATAQMGSYQLWDSENWKLILSSDVVLEDSILSNLTKAMKICKKVLFDLNRLVVDRRTDQIESTIWQIVENDQANDHPSESDSARRPLVKIDLINANSKLTPLKNPNGQNQHPGGLDESEGPQSSINQASTTSITWIRVNQAPTRKLQPH